MNKLRLKWKVFAFLLGFCALLLVILWLFQTVFLDAFYRNVRIMEMQKYAIEIINNSGEADITEIIESLTDNSDISIDIIDLQGRSKLRSFPYQDRFAINVNTMLISQARENGGEFYEYSTLESQNPRNRTILGNRTSQESLVYVKTATDAAGGGIAVIITAVISPVNATVTTLRYQLYVVSGVMILLSIVLAILIAKNVSKPIEEINRGALTLAKGNYETRFAVKGFHEIVTLSETLNTTAIELGRVEGLRRELLANVSHDLRTPLALIYSYAEMMSDFPGEITSEQVRVIMSETRRLTSLVNDVLDLSKLEADMEMLNISRFNITQSILETTKRIDELLNNDGFEINFTSSENVYVNADETKIGRAFYNLLINAINYSGESRAISVLQTVTGNRVRTSVTDTGEGIVKDELPLIWDRYYKSSKQHKRAITGTGMGLSIVRRIIELHGGSYGVQSEFGKGSTFWFELAI